MKRFWGNRLDSSSQVQGFPNVGMSSMPSSTMVAPLDNRHRWCPLKTINKAVPFCYELLWLVAAKRRKRRLTTGIPTSGYKWVRGGCPWTLSVSVFGSFRNCVLWRSMLCVFCGGKGWVSDVLLSDRPDNNRKLQNQTSNLGHAEGRWAAKWINNLSSVLRHAGSEVHKKGRTWNRLSSVQVCVVSKGQIFPFLVGPKSVNESEKSKPKEGETLDSSFAAITMPAEWEKQNKRTEKERIGKERLTKGKRKHQMEEKALIIHDFSSLSRLLQAWNVSQSTPSVVQVIGAWAGRCVWCLGGIQDTGFSVDCWPFILENSIFSSRSRWIVEIIVNSSVQKKNLKRRLKQLSIHLVNRFSRWKKNVINALERHHAGCLYWYYHYSIEHVWNWIIFWSCDRHARRKTWREKCEMFEYEHGVAWRNQALNNIKICIMVGRIDGFPTTGVPPETCQPMLTTRHKPSLCAREEMEIEWSWAPEANDLSVLGRCALIHVIGLSVGHRGQLPIVVNDLFGTNLPKKKVLGGRFLCRLCDGMYHKMLKSINNMDTLSSTNNTHFGSTLAASFSCNASLLKIFYAK